MNLASRDHVEPQRWADVLAELEIAVVESERLVEHGRLEEFRALPVPVVASALPPELHGRARSLQARMAALTERVVAAMAANRSELQVVTTARSARPERAVDGAARRQWQPSYVDARA